MHVPRSIGSAARRHRLAGLGLAYFVAASAAVGLTRFEGGVACLWIANALLLAALASRLSGDWRAAMLVCGLASMAATSLFGIGPQAALPLALANMGEVAISAVLLSRWQLRKHALSSLPQFAGFVLAAGFAGPIAGAVVGGGSAAWLSGTPYTANAINWFLGHALGALAFFPIFTFVFNGDLKRWTRQAGAVKVAEATAVLMLVAVIAIGVFTQHRFPLLFLPFLPVILATFWLGRLGAAGAVVIVAIVGGVATARGMGPIYLIEGGVTTHLQFFQFYLATMVLSALPVAAELARRKRLNADLRDSEARYRLMADNSTDIVMNLDRDGIIRYVSPSIQQIGGYTQESLAGQPVLKLVLPEDRDRVRSVHLAALELPAQTLMVEFRALTFDGDTRWFEATTRSVLGENDETVGVVSAIRDIAHRKQTEAELTRAATTDPLTGLCNRRGFDDEFAKRLAEARGSRREGCVAVFDVDHFKRVNDSYGHDAGDQVLESFASIARRTVRDSDLVGRLGGEEFGIILPGVTLDQAQYICNRLRIAVSQTTLFCGTESIRVTVSAGVARFDGHAKPDRVLKAADKALYAAKNAGRDRLMIAA
jgi:diguanylate cyclase (GGDEF)-like protein/PAS domain S-box-containing protein